MAASLLDKMQRGFSYSQRLQEVYGRFAGGRRVSLLRVVWKAIHSLPDSVRVDARFQVIVCDGMMEHLDGIESVGPALPPFAARRDKSAAVSPVLPPLQEQRCIARNEELRAMAQTPFWTFMFPRTGSRRRG